MISIMIISGVIFYYLALKHFIIIIYLIFHIYKIRITYTYAYILISCCLYI